MSFASKDLCQELWELSEWKTPKYHLTSGGVGRPIAMPISHPASNSVCPAYELGYLLRKLPLGCCGLFQSASTWIASYNDVYGEHLSKKPFMSTKAGTPEDAAIKLSIELFKQGILNKEIQHE